MAKKTIVRKRYPLEDNVKRALFIRPGGGGDDGGEFEIPYATREETDAGVLLDKSLNPDVGAYAYDRFRHAGQHTAGKGTAGHTTGATDGVVQIDCSRSNVFRFTLTGDATLGNPAARLRGQVINIIITQDAVGGHSLTFGDDYLWVLGVTPTVSSGAGAIDLISGQYSEAIGKWLCTYLPDFTGTGTGYGQFAVGPAGPEGPEGPQGPDGPAGADGDYLANFLVNLTDVDAYLAVDGDTLIYDAYLNRWVASPAAGASSPFKEEVSVSGAAATSLSSGTLDIGTDGAYEFFIEGKNASGSAATLSLYFNGDTTDANYDRQSQTGSGATHGGSRANSALLFTAAAGTLFSIRGTVMLDFDGKPVALIEAAQDRTTSLVILHIAIAHRTAANLTGLRLNSATASALAIGTRMTIWKKPRS